MKPLIAAALLALLATDCAAATRQGCGGPQNPCQIATGSYHIVLPAGDGPFPVMMFLHGYGGNGASLVRNSGASREALRRGYAYIAPNGLKRPGGKRTSWAFHPRFRQQRDERAFFQDVLKDAHTRFNVDPDRAVLAGFSIGGSMASYIACEHPEDFVAYAPVSGSFWRPHPDGCKGPVRLLHTHGWRDTTVPLEGRVLHETQTGILAQGDVFNSMRLWRAANGCKNYRADRFQTDARFWRRIWDNCTPGTALELALFDGGHGVPRGWAKMVFDWLDTLTPRVK